MTAFTVLPYSNSPSALSDFIHVDFSFSGNMDGADKSDGKQVAGFGFKVCARPDASQACGLTPALDPLYPTSSMLISLFSGNMDGADKSDRKDFRDGSRGSL